MKTKKKLDIHIVEAGVRKILLSFDGKPFKRVNRQKRAKA